MIGAAQGVDVGVGVDVGIWGEARYRIRTHRIPT